MKNKGAILMKDYYKILEVNENASKEIIEKTYKILIKKYHPDVHEENEKNKMDMKIKEINEAYKVLSNDFLREQYDNEWNKERAEYFRKKYGNNIKSNESEVIDKKEKIKDKVKNKDKNTNNNKKNSNRINEIKNKSGMLKLMSEIFKKRPNKIDLKNITKTDMQAAGLTVLVLIILGILLWFIPFTNSWMRQLIFENPLFSWIWS